MRKIQVGFADDQTLFRYGFSKLLKSFKEVDLIIEAESGSNLLEQIAIKGVPEVVLLDLDMPGMDGIKVAKILQEQNPEIKIIILTGHDDDNLIIRLLKDGINSYLHKDAHPEEVERAIFEVAEKGEYASKRALEAITNTSKETWPGQSSKRVALTKAEINIIKLICQGYKDAEIADKLNKGLRTIQNQRLILRKKIGAETIADIINYANKNKLIDGGNSFDFKT